MPKEVILLTERTSELYPFHEPGLQLRHGHDRFRGIQEETTYLGIPCLTLRPNTERPVTVTDGTNQLCDVRNFEEKAVSVLSENPKNLQRITFWDGKTAERVVQSIAKNSRA